MNDIEKDEQVFPTLQVHRRTRQSCRGGKSASNFFSTEDENFKKGIFQGRCD